MDFVYCPRCQQEQAYSNVWAFTGRHKGGILPFRVGIYVKCSVCRAIFIVALPQMEPVKAMEERKEVPRRASQDQGEGLLDR